MSNTGTKKTGEKMAEMPKKITRDSLLKLPARDWAFDTKKLYDHLLLVPAKTKHDSGWMHVAIIGVIRGEEGKPDRGEICAYPDDVIWNFPKNHPYDVMLAGEHRMVLRTDCYYPGGIMRFWGSSESHFRARFRVGLSLSSTDVSLVIEDVR